MLWFDARALSSPSARHQALLQRLAYRENYRFGPPREG